MSPLEIDPRLISARGAEDPQNELLQRAFATGRLPERAAALARIIFEKRDERAQLAATILAEHVRAASASELRALERDYRSPRFIRQWRSLAYLTDRWTLRAALDPEPRLAALAIGSVQRDGRIREEAVRELGERDEIAAAGLLLLRVNDPVSEVAAAAMAALELWRVPSRASDLARYLPLFDSLATWVRTGQTDVAKDWHALFAQDESVLFTQARSDDPTLRMSAHRRLAVVRTGQESIREVLELALSDRDARIRLWAATAAVDGAVAPTTVRDDLVFRMWEDPNPRIREIALRYLRRLEHGELSIERAIFDPNAGVRFYARRFAQRGGLSIPYRELALAVLADTTSNRSVLIGALALLSDNGVRDDGAMVRPFLQHPHEHVRREARRTLSLLER